MLQQSVHWSELTRGFLNSWQRRFCAAGQQLFTASRSQHSLENCHPVREWGCQGDVQTISMRYVPSCQVQESEGKVEGSGSIHKDLQIWVSESSRAKETWSIGWKEQHDHIELHKAAKDLYLKVWQRSFDSRAQGLFGKFEHARPKKYQESHD